MTEASRRINCWRPDDPFQHGTLGEDYVGVTVLDVFLGNQESIMTHARWPLSLSWFPSSQSLQETIAHFAAIPIPVDPLAYLGGMLKAPYRFIVRKRRICDKVSLVTRKTRDSEIQKVSIQDCCSRRCCQFIPQERTLMIQTKFYLKLFDERHEYVITSAGHIHNFDEYGFLKVITLDGMEVCVPAWYIIHGISKSAYHTYAAMYKGGVLSGDHGNKGVKRPRVGTVQATGTMKSIIDESTDQMPHQMRDISNGRMDTLKYLLAGKNWKRVRRNANEVYSCSFSKFLSIWRSPVNPWPNTTSRLWFNVVQFYSYSFFTFMETCTAASVDKSVLASQLNIDYSLPTVSQSTISRIKKDHFNNVAIKPVGSLFAKCTECDDLQQYILKSLKGSSEYVEFVKQRTKHLNHQASCRRIYASWCEE